MNKLDEILENYPELDSSRKAELKEEILILFNVSKSSENKSKIDIDYINAPWN